MTGPRQTIVIGLVVDAHVADRFVLDPERCYIDSPALDLVGRLHGSGWYSRKTDTLQMARPVYAQ